MSPRPLLLEESEAVSKMVIRFEGEVTDAAGVNVPTYEKAEHTKVSM
jgi:hypothetical protein